MCGIAGIYALDGSGVNKLNHKIGVMNKLIEHRGPDGSGIWANENQNAGFGHTRLSIIDLTENGKQPMCSQSGLVITYNGEIYNYKELKAELESGYTFKTMSDTEVVLACYEKYGEKCLDKLDGMFAFSIYDPKKNSLFCARDRFGIKPFYYVVADNQFIFASEIKALLPFCKTLDLNRKAFSEYLTFQYILDSETLFDGIHQLNSGHCMTIVNGNIHHKKYWDVSYEPDFNHTEKYFQEKTEHLITESVKKHLVSDVPIGSYLSGGVDSSLIGVIASENCDFYGGFHGKFTDFPGYDESYYARCAAEYTQKPLYEIEITPNDFIDNISKIIYHLDMPIAGPGSFPQYMVSQLVSKHVKVVLGGQGGDEIFGGYARYLIGYFDQCMKAAIEGTHKSGNFVVTPESIISNLSLLKEYKPLIRKIWSKNVFGPLDETYFNMIDRSADMEGEIDPSVIDSEHVMERFITKFNAQGNVRKEAYFDKMTHFDFKHLLPALLQVEDRMSMAHGVEARVPFLSKDIIEFAAKIPADYKFPGGKMKHLLKTAFNDKIPVEISKRRDKMGFPVPLKEWFNLNLKDYLMDTFLSSKSSNRGLYNTKAILNNLSKEAQFSRKTWGMLSLELWFQNFHDKHHEFRKMID